MRRTFASSAIATRPHARKHLRLSKLRATTKSPASGLPGLKLQRGPAHIQVVTRLQRRICRLERRFHHAHVQSISALVATVEAKDPPMQRHSVRVATIVEALATRINLSARQTDAIVTAALLHDIGKIRVPDSILRKPGPLTASEFDEIKKHPRYGVEILQPVGFFERELPLVLHHHEWYNGDGYPQGLRGEQIPIGARLLAVADGIDAMRSPRVYRRARPVAEVVEELKRFRGSQFDPRMADAAVEWLTSPSAAPSEEIAAAVSET